MKKHLPLIIGVSLPIIFIIIISVVVFIPSLFISPAHNFIYSTDETLNGYNQLYQNTFTVEDNHIITQPVTLQQGQVSKGVMPTLYLYDISNNASHQISFADAKGYSVDPGPSSPDGYTVKYEYQNNGIFGLFGSNGNDSGYYIEKDNGRRLLTGIASTNGYYYASGNFKIIGWIK